MRLMDVLRLKIPVGIMSGMKLRKTGKGLKQGSGMVEGLTILNKSIKYIVAKIT